MLQLETLPVPEQDLRAPSPSCVLPLLRLDTRPQKTNPILCLSRLPFSLHLYGMAFGFSLLVSVSVRVHVGIWETGKERSTISSPGSHDQPDPPKILSNATIFVQPALASAPCCTPNNADGRESPAWFPKTTPGAEILALVFRLFSSFPVFFYEANMLLQDFCGHFCREKLFRCRSHSLEDVGEKQNKACFCVTLVKNGTTCYCC